ncbi:hypothetical protein SynSYN20_02266 [Synechococcus sp. SYN20]|nr:hypothetical protein SynSYN20_02266 [Synechococcus sp. SYN20]
MTTISGWIASPAEPFIDASKQFKADHTCARVFALFSSMPVWMMMTLVCV